MDLATVIGFVLTWGVVVGLRNACSASTGPEQISVTAAARLERRNHLFCSFMVSPEIGAHSAPRRARRSSRRKTLRGPLNHAVRVPHAQP